MKKITSQYILNWINLGIKDKNKFHEILKYQHIEKFLRFLRKNHIISKWICNCTDYEEYVFRIYKTNTSILFIDFKYKKNKHRHYYVYI